MTQKILTLDADETQAKEFCKLLEKKDFPSSAVSSLHQLKEFLATRACLGVFIDVDTVSITNREIRDLTLNHPDVYFFCLSKRKFHPELQDAICYHVYACLNRPLDPDELFYFIRTIKNEQIQKDQGNYDA